MTLWQWFRLRMATRAVSALVDRRVYLRGELKRNEKELHPAIGLRDEMARECGMEVSKEKSTIEHLIECAEYRLVLKRMREGR